jgi:hypothetical protein
MNVSTSGVAVFRLNNSHVTQLISIPARAQFSKPRKQGLYRFHV